MKVNYALILAAGMGTRMGEIGKSLPKVLWPIFELRLLDLQILFAKKYKAEKVFVNTHFLSDLIEKYISKNYPDVTILKENPLLGSGGAIHNLAAQNEINYKGNLLILNGDQFLFYDEETQKKLISDKDYNVRLLSLHVPKGSEYNGLIVEDGLLRCIEKNTHFSGDYVTYSGVSLIDLNRLERVPGVSSFFNSVANFDKRKIEVIVPQKQEYWDFGTLPLYKDNMHKLLNAYIDGENFQFVELCSKNKVFCEEKINTEMRSYFSKQRKNQINLTKNDSLYFEKDKTIAISSLEKDGLNFNL